MKNEPPERSSNNYSIFGNGHLLEKVKELHNPIELTEGDTKASPSIILVSMATEKDRVELVGVAAAS